MHVVRFTLKPAVFLGQAEDPFLLVLGQPRPPLLERTFPLLSDQRPHPRRRRVVDLHAIRSGGLYLTVLGANLGGVKIKRTGVLADEESPTSQVGLAEAARAFEQEDHHRATIIESSPVMAFLDYHDQAGTPGTQVITGVGDVKVTLADLKNLIRALK